jgi:hypothetical protein
VGRHLSQDAPHSQPRPTMYRLEAEVVERSQTDRQWRLVGTIASGPATTDSLQQAYPDLMRALRLVEQRAGWPGTGDALRGRNLRRELPADRLPADFPRLSAALPQLPRSGGVVQVRLRIVPAPMDH